MQHRRYERHLRTRVRRQRGCLDALGSTTRRLLGLRAGLRGRALSRGQAASRLGISSRRAARLEHAGLRTLQLACGVEAASASPRVARLTRSAPVLEPASFLVPAASAPALKPAAELTKRRGSHGVESASATSRPSEAGVSGGGAPLSAAAALEPGGSGPGLAVILAICLATLAVVGLVALRRSVAGREQPATATPAASPPAAEPEPAATYVTPPAPAQPPAQPPATEPSPARRAATVAATSAVGFLVRELIRRRAGRR